MEFGIRQLIAKRRTMDMEADVMSSKVSATGRNLKRKFSTSAADTGEEKRQKIRKIENEWKAKNGKKKRIFAKTLNFFRQICMQRYLKMKLRKKLKIREFKLVSSISPH